MSIAPQILHAFSVGVAIVLGGLGGGIGQGIAGFGSLKAMYRQPTASDKILRTMILGLALIETGAILALVIIFMILFGGLKEITLGAGLAELGMGLAIGLSAAAISIASSFAVKSACESIARQPFFTQKIMTLMLLSQSIIGAPGVFAFIVALLIKMQISSTTTVVDGIKFLAAGVTIGVGSIGPSIGQGIFSTSSCKASGINKEAFSQILTFSLLSQAVIQTPIIFCLVISLTTIFKQISQSTMPFIAGVTFFSPAFAISIGSMGTAIAIGFAASKMTNAVALDTKNYPLFVRASLLAQAIIESAAIYALIVALVLMTKGI
jgi:F0F1-type ATP synthase membrane subunit c/vacuolar-type H+-ATPase subunit K